MKKVKKCVIITVGKYYYNKVILNLGLKPVIIISYMDFRFQSVLSNLIFKKFKYNIKNRKI